MALFEYFPNYAWNLSLSIAMQSDNMAYGRDYIADRFVDTLGGHTA